MDYENSSSAGRASRGLAATFKEALRHLIANDEGLDPEQIRVTDYWEVTGMSTGICETCSFDRTQVMVKYLLDGVWGEYTYDGAFFDLIRDLDYAMKGERS